MKNEGTGSPQIPDAIMDELLDRLIARGGEKFYQGFEERLAQKEQEKERARREEMAQKEEAIRQAWLEEHYGNLKNAIDGDEEFKGLLQGYKGDPSDLEFIVNNMMEYKDKAPAMLKHILRNENVFNDLTKARDMRDGRYLLHNVFADVNKDLNQAPNQQSQQQNGNAEKPVKLPAPQIMPELPASANIDDEVADSISRM